MKQTLMYTKDYVGIFLVFVLLFWGVHASAQENMLEAPPMRDSAQMMEREEQQAERMEIREERRAALTQQMQDRIANLTSNVEKRLTVTITRMEDIVGRLFTRIQKLDEMGVDTSRASQKLSDAQSTIDAARDALETLGSVRTAMSSDTPRESFNSIREQLMVVRDFLKQAHEQLRETVALLKEAIRATELSTGVSEAVSNSAPPATTE